jgi:hypothetical protein
VLQVLHALKENSGHSLDVIGRVLPAFLHRLGREPTHMPGSLYYRDLQSGKFSYRMYCFAKDSGQHPGCFRRRHRSTVV